MWKRPLGFFFLSWSDNGEGFYPSSNGVLNKVRDTFVSTLWVGIDEFFDFIN